LFGRNCIFSKEKVLVNSSLLIIAICCHDQTEKASLLVELNEGKLFPESSGKE
jgi:hypothetical protein